MTDILVTSPYRPFTLPTQFKAVFNGYIYCGTVDAADPSVSQVQVYLVNESGDKVPVAQPLRTNAGGFLVYNGQPAKFVTSSNHSLLVRDSLGSQLWYAPNMASVDPDALFGVIRDTTATVFKNDEFGSAVENMVAGRVNGIAGAVTHTAGNVYSTGWTTWVVKSVNAAMELSDFKALGETNVNDFGADFSGGLDSSSAFNAALISDSSKIVAAGSYVLTNPVIIPSGKSIDLTCAKVAAKDGIQGDYTHQGVFVFDGVSDSTIIGGELSMYGELFTSDGATVHGIVSMVLVKNSSRITLERLRVDGGCNRFGDNFEPVGALVHFTNSHNCMVSNCSYEGYYKTGSPHDGDVIGYAPYTECIAIDSSSSYINVTNNTLLNPKYSGIAVGATGGSVNRCHTITDNFVSGTGGTCISLNGSGCTVKGNILAWSYDNNGIIIGHTNDVANNNIITGNVIRNVWFNGITFSDKAFNNICSDNTIIDANMSSRASADFASHYIRIRGKRNICKSNTIQTSASTGYCAISCWTDDNAQKYSFVGNIIDGNTINGGFISIKAPLTHVKGNFGDSGAITNFIEVGFRSSYTIVTGNSCYNVGRCVSVYCDTTDPQDYIGITVSGNYGSTLGDAEVSNVNVNRTQTLTENQKYIFANSSVSDREVGWFVGGTSNDASLSTQKDTGSIKAISQNAFGSAYGYVMEASTMSDGQLTKVEALEVSAVACEIKSINNGQSNLILTNEFGVRYKLRVTGSALSIVPA